MRRIQTKEALEKKKRKNQILMGVVMTSLLLLSTLGYSLMSGNKNDKSEINEFGIDFYRENGLWVADFDGDRFAFQNLPSEVSDVEVNGTFILGQYSGQPLYLVDVNQGASEIINNIGKYILRYQEACLINSTCEGNWPEKDCSSNLIIFESGNETKVYQDENCAYIVGDSIKAADAFLYRILGITQ